MLTSLVGAPHFAYQNGELYCEAVSLGALAQTYGSPLFVYSKAALLESLAAYEEGLQAQPHQICYAVKANSHLAILQCLAQRGCGFDIVSVGELERVRRAGGAMERVVFSGVGKRADEIEAAIHAGIGCFNVESMGELHEISRIASSLGKVANVSLRVNPDVDAMTHPYIATGLENNKFGISHQIALSAYQEAAELPGLHIVGIDCHIGSQITQLNPYLDALDKVLDLVEAIEAAGIPVAHIDMGGGLGVRYQDETPPSPQALYEQVIAKLKTRGHAHKALWVEPGRSLIANAGVCVTQVLYLKSTIAKNFCIVDAAMNDLPRAAMYEAFHSIVPVTLHSERKQEQYEVVGPVCESGDWLGRDRELAVQVGEHLAVLSAGAYCTSMASNYNSRNRAAEVLVDGSQVHLITQRETLDQQMQNEHLITE